MGRFFSYLKCFFGGQGEDEAVCLGGYAELGVYILHNLLYYYNTYTLAFQCDKLAKFVKVLTRIVFIIAFAQFWWYIYWVKMFFQGD